MANRFTDSRKWDDPWFRKLPCKYKAFFIFLIDKCDHAGIWKIDLESAEFHIGEKFNKNELLTMMNGRIIELKDKWFIPKFINFQYQVSSIAELNPDNRVHKSVIDLLKKEGAYKGLKKPLQGDIDKDKDKDKDNKGIVKGKVRHLDFVLLTPEEYSKLMATFGEQGANDFIYRLNEYGHTKPKKFKEYGSHYHTILSWAKKDNPKSGIDLTKQQRSNLQQLVDLRKDLNNDKPGV